MTHDRDPLLRAVRDGDTACPDGTALAALGRQVREVSALPREVDLIPRVLASLERSADDETDLDDDAIDTFYDGGTGPIHSELSQLAALVRTGSALPDPVDLEAQVRARLAGGSLRLTLRRATDTGSRFRIWSAVIAGHVAALLAIATWHQHRNEDAAAPAQHGTSVTSVDPTLHSVVGGRGFTAPHSWQDLTAKGQDLFAPRRSAESRQREREGCGLAETAALVTGSISWLIDQQDSDGHFGLIAGTPERDLATQSLACLVLLGEGLDDEHHVTAARASLRWIDTQRPASASDSVAAGLAALALVEGALLLDDPDLRAAATIALSGALPDQPGPSGLGGFSWTALQLAHVNGLPVSGHSLATAERTLARVLPTDDYDAGRIGLAAFARLVSGRHALASTGQLMDLLRQDHLRPRIDAANRIDPLGTLFATWAVRQAGNPPWEAWAKELGAAATPAYQRLGDLAWVPAARVRFADAVPNGDVFATAVTTLALQAPYRSAR